MSNEEITYEQVLEYCKKRNLDLVDHAFLVRLYNNREAIPIEWIVNWLNKSNRHYCDTDQMLLDWEKENETN